MTCTSLPNMQILYLSYAPTVVRPVPCTELVLEARALTMLCSERMQCIGLNTCHTSDKASTALHACIASARCIVGRVTCAGGKPSWTAKLLADPTLLCAKVREEAGELAATLEAGEGPERAASEAADLLYHTLVLLNLQVGGSSCTSGALGKVFSSFVYAYALMSTKTWSASARPSRPPTCSTTRSCSSKSTRRSQNGTCKICKLAPVKSECPVFVCGL